MTSSEILILHAQRAAEEHLEQCIENIDSDDQPGVMAPFCGCYTCTVREVLNAAWPYAMSAARLEVERGR